MRSWSLTSGARRALARAAVLAEWRDASYPHPIDLLCSLLCEESRATSLLVKAGADLGQIWGQLRSDHAATSRWPVDYDDIIDHHGFDAATERASATADWRGTELEVVLLEAQGLARQKSAGPDVGTEHLLVGLAIVTSPASLFLTERGWTREALDPAATPTAAEIPIRPAERIIFRQHATGSDERVSALRIMDAAANRCREGLRVMEDVCRLGRDQSLLTRELKQFRHDLTGVLSQLPMNELLSARDVSGDVGTEIGTTRESQRHSLIEIATAGIKRVQEALRSLEELAKLAQPSLAESLEQLRYRSYRLEQQIFAVLVPDRRLDARPLYLLLSRDHCRHPWERVLREALSAGVSVVQIREKSMSDRQLLDHTRRVLDWARQADAVVILNDRVDLALIAEVDGVHLGQDDLPIAAARRLLGSERLLGWSTHNPDQLEAAHQTGIDYLGVGPTFPSSTKSFDDFAGLDFVRQAHMTADLPWFAIGGITEDNIQDVIAAGARRVAVSSAICRSDDPLGSTRRLLEALQEANDQ